MTKIFVTRDLESGLAEMVKMMIVMTLEMTKIFVTCHLESGLAEVMMIIKLMIMMTVEIKKTLSPDLPRCL